VTLLSFVPFLQALGLIVSVLGGLLIARNNGGKQDLVDRNVDLMHQVDARTKERDDARSDVADLKRQLGDARGDLEWKSRRLDDYVRDDESPKSPAERTRDSDRATNAKGE